MTVSKVLRSPAGANPTCKTETSLADHRGLKRFPPRARRITPTPEQTPRLAESHRRMQKRLTGAGAFERHLVLGCEQGGRATCSPVQLRLLALLGGHEPLLTCGHTDRQMMGGPTQHPPTLQAGCSGPPGLLTSGERMVTLRAGVHSGRGPGKPWATECGCAGAGVGQVCAAVAMVGGVSLLGGPLNGNGRCHGVLPSHAPVRSRWLRLS